MRCSARHTTHLRKQGLTLWMTFKDNASQSCWKGSNSVMHRNANFRRPFPCRNKDVPIILAAIEARATRLLTGDVRHFGPYFGKNVGGVQISLPERISQRTK